MPLLIEHLHLPQCPHCGISHPLISTLFPGAYETQNIGNTLRRAWRFYNCSNCGGVIIASAVADRAEITQMFPNAESVDELIPDRPKTFLAEAIRTLHAPVAAVMVAASAIDAMLKEKGLREGSLYARINQAVEQNLITREMSDWAHHVRLEANDQRHADENAPLPTQHDARLVIDFAKALAEFLFVLPARVTRGIRESASAQA
jgi:hypothetical protein